MNTNSSFSRYIQFHFTLETFSNRIYMLDGVSHHVFITILGTVGKLL